jgi:6-phosphofructokinase 1
MTRPAKRIAINFGGGYVPGLNAVLTGTVMAASELGWEVVGIRDGFEGLLFPDRYTDRGLMSLNRSDVERLSSASGSLLGNGGLLDPFRVRRVNAENHVEEVDLSGDLADRLLFEKIDAVITIAGVPEMSILWKLHRKGMRTVCIPKSAENDVAATVLSFGFNSTLSFAAEMLDRAHQAAGFARRIGVVEVLGEHAGWLALQAGMAAQADAVLIPEIPYDLRKIAAKLRKKSAEGRTYGLVVVAEGARPLDGTPSSLRTSDPHMKNSLSPGATGNEGFYVMERSGQVAAEVALEIQRLTDQETSPLVLGQLAKGGMPTVVDRQLGLGYGAGAVRALMDNRNGVMVVFQPPDLNFVSMAEAINRFRTVPVDSEFVRLARALGISLGD